VRTIESYRVPSVQGAASTRTERGGQERLALAGRPEPGRDIKPQNLFSCGAGDDAHVKIIDFGLAVRNVDRAPEHRRLAPRLAGSPAFMNPDDLMGRTLPSAQSDLWALAVTAYLMLTRRLPFRAPSHVMWHQPKAWHFELPSSHRADIAPRVDEWFQRAFSRDPAERFQLAADAGREFCDALADHRNSSLSLRPCLSDDEILAFSSGSMSLPDVQLADAHIGACPACSDLLSTVVSLTGEEPSTMNASPTRSLSRVAWGLSPSRRSTYSEQLPSPRWACARERLARRAGPKTSEQRQSAMGRSVPRFCT